MGGSETIDPLVPSIMVGRYIISCYRWVCWGPLMPENGVPSYGVTRTPPMRRASSMSSLSDRPSNVSKDLTNPGTTRDDSWLDKVNQELGYSYIYTGSYRISSHSIPLSPVSIADPPSGEELINVPSERCGGDSTERWDGPRIVSRGYRQAVD